MNDQLSQCIGNLRGSADVATLPWCSTVLFPSIFLSLLPHYQVNLFLKPASSQTPQLMIKGTIKIGFLLKKYCIFKGAANKTHVTS